MRWRRGAWLNDVSQPGAPSGVGSSALESTVYREKQRPRQISPSPSGFAHRNRHALLRTLLLLIGQVGLLALAAACGYRAGRADMPLPPNITLPRSLHGLNSTPPLSDLGWRADDVYSLLPADVYEATLRQFIEESMPPYLRPELLARLDSLPPPATTVPLQVWQTNKDWPDLEQVQRIKGWHRVKVTNYFLDDTDAANQVEAALSGSELFEVYKRMQFGVLKADFWRYFVLLLNGGIYSDLDTVPLKEPRVWGLLPNQSERVDVNVLLGIELDLDERGYVGPGVFWEDGMVRPLQIIQWTMLASPMHPIFIDMMRRIVKTSRELDQWHKMRNFELGFLGSTEKAVRLRGAQPWQAFYRDYGEAVCEWTGPGAFTDAVFSYLQRLNGTRWTDLRNIPEPVQIGDVIIGPKRMFRAEPNSDDVPGACVEHLFMGSWTNAGNPRLFESPPDKADIVIE